MLVAQSCLTLCDPMDCSLLGSSVHGILQARILECVTIPFSRDLPNPRIEPVSPGLQADSLPSEPVGKPKRSILLHKLLHNYCITKADIVIVCKGFFQASRFTSIFSPFVHKRFGHRILTHVNH